MNKIDNILKEGLMKVLNSYRDEVTINADDIIIEIPKDNTKGDYSSNAALKLAKKYQVKPIELAEFIKEHFDYDGCKVESIAIAQPGFINFFMDKSTLVNSIAHILEQGDAYGQQPLKDDILFNVEYVSANPTGDLHVGHARQASLGDSITRIYNKAGYQVVREYYINDAGNQIQNLTDSVIARYHQLYDIDMNIPEGGYYGQDIKDIALLIKNTAKDKYLNDKSTKTWEYFKQTALNFELDKLKEDLKDFRVEFDQWTSEQKLYDDGKVTEALELLKSKQATYESEGATWLKTTKYGDDKDRVLQKSDGTYTYLMPDIANHLQKLANGANHLVDLWGADHHGYINRMKIALALVTDQKDLLDIDIVQLVHLVQDGQEVKMSKRSGYGVSLTELVNEVGLDAVRYFCVARSGNSHLDFDLDLAVKQSNENPVFYVQYAHARICSIINIASELKLDEEFDASLLTNPKEIDLIKHLNEFSSTIEGAAAQRAPHRITNYVQKLASLFHSYYNECKVINQDDLKMTNARLALLKACKITIKNSLELVGVSAPERM